MRDAVILAVDTTAEAGSIALLRQGTFTTRALGRSDGFAQVIFQTIRQLLEEAQISLSEIDCFAAASGPGSFTGVRVGLTAMKGLAHASGKPAAGISNLRALSLAGHSPLRAVALDARRNELYTGLYNAEAQLVGEERVCAADAWLASLPPESELIGLADGPLAATGRTFTAAPALMAQAIAECAALDGSAGWHDPADLDANYVRRSDSELHWADNRR